MQNFGEKWTWITNKVITNIEVQLRNKTTKKLKHWKRKHHKSGVFPPDSSTSLIDETLERLYKESQQLEHEYKFTFDKPNRKMNKGKRNKQDKTILWSKITAAPHELN